MLEELGLKDDWNEEPGEKELLAMLGPDAEPGTELLGPEGEEQLQSLAEMLREAKQDTESNPTSKPMND